MQKVFSNAPLLIFLNN